MTHAMDFVNKLRVGVSIGDTLDSFRDSIGYETEPAESETCWGNPVITEDLVKTYLKNGFNVIRIPVTWRKHIGPAPEYAIHEKWMARVKEVVDYVYQNGGYVILNIHHEDWNDPYYENRTSACDKMKRVWKQIAESFQDYDEHLIFEGQNEPRKIGTPMEWNGGDKEGWDVVNATNEVFVKTVRETGGRNRERFLMIPGYAANCTEGIRHIQIPKEDDRILVSVHAYEPYDFALKIPGRSTWNHDTEKIDTLMQDLKTLFLDHNIPVVLGEFGAMNKEDNEAEREEWVTYYVKAASAIGVPCIWWDNGRFQGKGELFGLFSRYNYQCAYPKVLNGLMKGSENRG